ncbi:hypothetical protein H0H87_007668, partial [Tephrocybe sp. NHM501043]
DNSENNNGLMGDKDNNHEQNDADNDKGLGGGIDEGHNGDDKDDKGSEIGILQEEINLLYQQLEEVQEWIASWADVGSGDDMLRTEFDAMCRRVDELTDQMALYEAGPARNKILWHKRYPFTIPQMCQSHTIKHNNMMRITHMEMQRMIGIQKDKDLANFIATTENQH